MAGLSCYQVGETHERTDFLSKDLCQLKRDDERSIW